MSMSVGSINDFVHSQLESAQEDEARAAAIGNQLSRSEDALLALYSRGEWTNDESIADRVKYLERLGLKHYVTNSDGSVVSNFPTLEGIQKAAMVSYQRVMRAFEAFMTTIRNTDQIIRSAIQNLRVG